LRNGLPYQAQGTADALSGASNTQFAHGCETFPQWITSTGDNAETATVYYTNFGGLVQANFSGALSAGRTIAWAVRSAGPYGRNLVNNPSAESGTVSPSAWNAGAGTTWIEDDPANGPSDTVFSGTRSLHLQTVSGTGDWRSSYFAVEASADYLVGAMITGAAIADCYLTIRWFSDATATTFISEQNISLVGTHTGWVYKSDTATAPGTAQSADVMIRQTSANICNIFADDIEVRKVL
jgi:hypothetical protein